MRQQAFKSSSAGQSRRFRKEGFCKAIIVGREAELTALARVESSASASTSLGSTGHISAAHVVVSCRPMRGTASQLCPHAFRPGGRSSGVPALHEGRSDGLQSQAPGAPRGDGGAPSGAFRSFRASRGSAPERLMWNDSSGAHFLATSTPLQQQYQVTSL